MAKRIDVIAPPPLEQSAGGRVNFGSPQQQWHGDKVMQLALFAGQEMMAIMMEKEAGFRLGYLGFNQHGFPRWNMQRQQRQRSPGAFSKN